LPGVHERLEILEGKSIGGDESPESGKLIVRADVEEGGNKEISLGGASEEILRFFRLLGIGKVRIVG